MPQSLAKILVHTVFSTKERRSFLRDGNLREELYRYIGGILLGHDCQPILIGGVEDHVHILSTLSRTCQAAEMVKEVKRASSLWIKNRTADRKILPGKTVTAFSRLVFRKSNRCALTSQHRRSIIERSRFKKNCGNY